MTDTAALDVQGLTAHAGSAVLHSINLHVLPGECLAIVGSSGAGKSVLARSLLGLTQSDPHWRVTANRIALSGHDLTDASAATWRRARGQLVSLVLQDALQSLDPLRPIGAEIGETLAIHHRIPRHEHPKAITDAMSAAGLTDVDQLVRRRSGELSGGMRQRALIAAALVSTPPLIVADEPTASLDTATAHRVLDEFARIRDAGTAVILVSHDLAAVARVADRVAVLDAGRIIETGPVDTVLTTPAHPTTRVLTAANILTLPQAPADEPGGPLLELTGVTRNFGGRGGRFTGIRDAHLTLRRGEAVGVTGASGAGKTTLARIIAGAEPIDSGTIVRRGSFRMIPQDPLATFDPRWRVRRILETSNQSAHSPEELLVRVGLSAQYLDRFPATLSGGERQRVAIARALAAEPDVLVCDEPVSALDPHHRAGILTLLAELRSTIGIVFISHDIPAVEALCQRVVTVTDGELTP